MPTGPAPCKENFIMNFDKFTSFKFGKVFEIWVTASSVKYKHPCTVNFSNVLHTVDWPHLTLSAQK